VTLFGEGGWNSSELLEDRPSLEMAFPGSLCPGAEGFQCDTTVAATQDKEGDKRPLFPLKIIKEPRFFAKESCFSRVQVYH
jgi:hypothetical protein